ncbi:unnamed protein product [Closterium sp. NIES-53]
MRADRSSLAHGSTTCSLRLAHCRDAAARLAIRNHLPLAGCAHFGQHRTAQALYDAVVARYSSLATTALGRLLLPYLFPELSAFATIEDLVSHLRTSDACYRAALPAEFLAKNPPSMFITLYLIVTHLHDSLCAVRDNFLVLDPTELTVDLLEQNLLAAETSVVAVGAAHGTPRTPFFEGCSPSPLAPSYASAAAVDVLGAEDVGAASACGKRRSSKGKGGRGGGGGSGGGGLGGGGGGSGGSGGGGSGGSGGGRTGAQRGGSGGGQRQRQQRRSETPSPQQLRERLFQRGASRGSVSCPYVIRTGDRAGQTCEKHHTQHRCFSRLDDAWRAEFGDEVERPHWAEQLRCGVAILYLDYDAILFAMYALSASAEGDYYQCVPPDPGIAAAALGASESSLPGTKPAEALHTFTLDSGASQCFFRDTTTLTPLPAPDQVRLTDPSRGPVVACSSTVLPCLAVPSCSLSSLHIPSFSTKLRVSICKSTRTGRHLATFTRRPGSSLYTLATGPPQVAAFAQVSASGQVAPPCSCRLLSHQTLLWNHRLGHPSLPRLRGMHSCLLVSGLPKSLPPLPPSPAPPCLPCVEGRQRAAPHSSSFPPATAPLQTLHMDVWGLARVSGQGRERYFLLVVDDFTWYTTVFLCSKDLLVLRLHSDRGGEFSSDLLRDFCRGEGVLQSFTLPDSPQQNGIAERRIGLVMEVARTSMIHAAAPHFLWSFAVRYSAHQLNLWPRVSLPETSPTLSWTGKVGDASVFRVWGSRAFVRDTSGDKLFARAIPFGSLLPSLPLPLCPSPTPAALPYSRSLSGRPPPPQCPAQSGVSQVDPLPGTAPVEVADDSGTARGAASGGAEPGGADSEGTGSGGAEPGGAESEGIGCGGAEPRGAQPGGDEPAGVEPWGAEPEGVEPGGVESVGVEPGGAEWEGAESGGAEPRGAASSGGPAGASPSLSTRPGTLSPQQLRECLVRRARLRSGATGAGGTGDTGAGGVGVTIGAGGTGGTATDGPGGARTWGTGAAGTGGVGGAGARDPTEPGAAGAGGARAGGAGAGDAWAGGAGAVGAGAGGAGAVDPELESQPPLQPASPLPAPSPYTEQTSSLTERHEPPSRPASPVRTSRRVPRPRPPPVPGTHAMALRPSSVQLRVPLLAPPESSLPEVPDPESDHACAASPTVSRLLAIAVTDPSFASTAASALVAELVNFAATCHLYYATALIAESESSSPLSVGGECALCTDVLEDRQEDFESLAAAVPHFASMLLASEGDPDSPDIPTPRSYEEAITGPYYSQWQAAMDAEMASWKSTGTYVHEVPTPGANIVDGMWIYRVKRPLGSPPAFKVHYVARGFSQRQSFAIYHFRPLLDKCVIIYLDDILVYSRDKQQHLADLEAVFTVLDKHRLLTKGSKCEFFQDRLEFLGHVISEAGVEIDPKKLDTVKAWQSPMNITELQSFLGFVNYVRRFVPDMARLTAPLTDLLQKGVAFTWGGKEHASFYTLKKISSVHRPYCASLTHTAHSKWLPTQATSPRRLHPPDKNYPIHDREMLAIVHAFKVWRCYLTGADVTVRTDHKSLHYLRAQPHLNPRQIRWLDYLESNFHYTVTYKKWASNIADALTRRTAQLHAILLA